ncbi:MAG TPA: twin-arginine translocation signal domain-containing protein [Candidatus Sulfotelmatobacter sp.]
MTTTRRDFLTAAAVTAGVAVTPDVGEAHEHEHEHDHDHQAVPSDPALRVKALESLLVEKGLVDRVALDPWLTLTNTRLVRGMALEWWRGRGQILRISNGC